MTKVIIIAEAGVNHNGNVNIAKQLVDSAVFAGADIIKFQTFKTKNLVTKNSPKAPYQKKITNTNETQYEMLKKLQLNIKQTKIIKDYCKRKKIEFLSSPFDLESLKLLTNLKVKKIKIASGEITNYPLLRDIAKLKKETILSTGMSKTQEITQAIKVLQNYGLSRKNIILLHCTSAYPTPLKHANLTSINYLKNKFKLKVGYSDHTEGITASVAAVALGSEVIEKHITLNKKAKGPDHSSSLDPKGFRELVREIRKVEKLLGKYGKFVTKNEKQNIKIVRKSIYAKKNINIGEKFSEDNLISKRPAKGLSPMSWNNIIGRISKKNYHKDDLIK